MKKMYQAYPGITGHSVRLGTDKERRSTRGEGKLVSHNGHLGGAHLEIAINATEHAGLVQRETEALNEKADSALPPGAKTGGLVEHGPLLRGQAAATGTHRCSRGRPSWASGQASGRHQRTWWPKGTLVRRSRWRDAWWRAVAAQPRGGSFGVRRGPCGNPRISRSEKAVQQTRPLKPTPACPKPGLHHKQAAYKLEMSVAAQGRGGALGT